MMKSVIDGGTGGRVRFRYGIKAEMGGKTGTTQNNSRSEEHTSELQHSGESRMPSSA